MEPARRRNRMEMIFIISLVVLCGSLSALQYRWTGELAEAEMDRMKTSLLDQATRLCRAFDSELAQSCSTLVPTVSELDRGTVETVHVSRLHSWKSTKPRPIFKRIAVAIPSGEKLDLFEINGPLENPVLMEWPAGWEDLRESLEEKITGFSEPFEDPTGLLMEFPVIAGRPWDGHGGSGSRQGPGGIDRRKGGTRHEAEGINGTERRGGGEAGPPVRGMGVREWIILELDEDYIRQTWLPELVDTYLNHEEKAIYDITVKSKESGEVIFSTLKGSAVAAGDKLVLGFNYHGLVPDGMRGRPREPDWIMETTRREGALEGVISGSRGRNLAVAVALNFLILVAGFLLLRATRHSRKLAEEQMKFVANVTHELRTPLTVIRGAAHNMKRGIVKDQAGIATYSGLILEHAESLGEMVEQVLDFSGARQGQLGSERTEVDIGTVLRGAISTTTGGGRFPGCEVELAIPAGLPPVTGDPAALRRVFINLIENAAKHGGASGTIVVTAEAKDGMMEIRVADQGPGIPAAELRDIFNPFFRGGIARTYQIRGSGLGLSLVKEIVAAHGGTVSVASEAGHGSVFTVSLPGVSAEK